MIDLIIKIIKFLFPKTYDEIYLDGYSKGYEDSRKFYEMEIERHREEETIRIKRDRYKL